MMMYQLLNWNKNNHKKIAIDFVKFLQKSICEGIQVMWKLVDFCFCADIY